MLRRYTRAQMEEFLREVDRHLEAPCEVVLIGGAVIALVYKGTHATTDVDLIKAEPEFWTAVEAATARSKEPIPVQKAAIAQPPYDYEDRLSDFELAGLTRLQLRVPERHDLALMKIARGEAHDLNAIEDIHKAEPLDLETLIERYHSARTQVIGSVTDHQLKFLAAVDRLFGTNAADSVEARLAGTPPKADQR